MPTLSYPERRGEIEDYFDRTAVDAWKALTSDAPVSGIRATVRAGRDRMRTRLSTWLPDDLAGQRILDAGCGTGALALELAARGADVVAVDLSPSLVDLAAERAEGIALRGSVRFLSGDMLDPLHGDFDHVVAMDSLIHYESEDAIAVLSGLAARTRRSIAFTFAPSSPLLELMHAVGRLFPRNDRAPSIVPVRGAKLAALIDAAEPFADWSWESNERVHSGFYTSEAVYLRREASA
ncbi:MAG: magnesium protoporphyrin IX methyltransferase [Pseudomonadota bacterium]|nr:magnesium protoporphyrin IX methyltransferase [Pseudomonadota bacterium]